MVKVVIGLLNRIPLRLGYDEPNARERKQRPSGSVGHASEQAYIVRVTESD